HPDLVNRLADEAGKAAQHVLNMCVRALDYCPPVDLTFGEYLRALVTADVDLVPEDGRDYRVAFVEAFRRRGLYPRDLRTLSVENLRWRGPEEDDRRPSDALTGIMQEMRSGAHKQLYAKTRKDIFDEERRTRFLLHRRLTKHFASGDEGRRDAEFLGLSPDESESFEVHSAHFATRLRPDGTPQLRLFFQLTQEVPVPGPEGSEAKMVFQGGSTVVVDLKEPRVTYCIRKPVSSLTRRERQRRHLAAQAEHGLRATYFGPPEAFITGGDDEDRRRRTLREPFALLHRATG
ncbi:MAG TPA: hypothetical protein VFR37_02415, partial [Longimicrobium sp.]|nr:hypothetical protein [Longimicrobium sp.]